MGGAICIAIKKGDEEHVFDAWTNGFNWVLCQPSFRTGGKWYQEYIKRSSPDNEWPKTRTIKTIHPIEYGLVMIDLNYQHVWSRNVYSHPGCIYSNRYDPEAVKLTRSLIRLGQVSHLEYTLDSGDKHFVRIAEPPSKYGLCMKRDVSVQAYIAQHVLFVEHVCAHPKGKDMEWARRWAEARGWKSPFRKPRKKAA